MTKVVYSGGHAAVEVPLPDGRLERVEAGKAVDLPEELVKALCDSEDWNRKSDNAKPKE